MMVLITLIGEEQAKIGNRFYYLGALTECKECRLRGVCFNLEPGHQYEVTGLRDTEHDCILTESKVRVVEVEKRSTLAAVPRKKAIDGSMITFESIRCDRLGCDNYIQCHPIGMENGMKMSIVDVVGDIDCPKEESLVLVKLD